VQLQCTFDVFIFLDISQPGWMELDPGSSNLFNPRPMYKSIHVKRCFEVEHGKSSLDYQPMI